MKERIMAKIANLLSIACLMLLLGACTALVLDIHDEAFLAYFHGT
jgi:hypothetical protein